MFIQLQLLIIGSLAGVALTGGVFPNYRANFDFITWDARKAQAAGGGSQQEWWQTAFFYQIYPRSFKDSNGDGVGDLNGITQQLAYLKEIGVTAAWLSPIFTSPMADFGYDISNFTEIDPLFGSMADFDALLAKAQQLGVKIILDFVPNHSSDECEWFRKSAARDPDYEDFYIWHPGKLVDGERRPPSNWLSVFRGSAWHWHEGRQEYYFHQFLSKQPDLNFRNPKVRQAMHEILRFWLQRGVYGFRIDSVPHVFEVAPDGLRNWPDEPRNDWVTDPDDYGYLKHIYTTDQPETVSILYEWRKVLDDFKHENGGDDRILMTESYSPLEIVMQYYGNGTAEGAQIPFNFQLLSWLTNASDANHYAQTVNTWLNSMPAGRTANWVIGNHDKNRVGSRLGADRVDMMNMLTFTLPGCSISYNGEEIGMTDVWISWNDTVDPSACNSNPDIYQFFSRDPERTPFQWNDEKNAGFSTANKTWLPIAANYKTVNVKHQRGVALSPLNVFKQLRAVREEPTIKFGDVEVKALNNDVLGIKRSLLNNYTFLTLMNIFDKVKLLDLTKSFPNLATELEYVVVTEKSIARKGDHVKSSAIRLLPKEAVILRSTTKLTTTVGYFAYYPSE